MKKKRRHRHPHREQYTGSLEERDTADLSEMLAPPEEQRAAAKDRTIVVDASTLKVPTALADSDEDGRRILGFEPVVLAIVVLVAAFICFVAYLISVEPPKQ